MKAKRESKDIRTKKAILEALEDKPKYSLGSLIGGFIAIMVAQTTLNKMVEVSIGGKENSR